MIENLNFFFNRILNKLWFRPLLFCLLSIGAALLAHLSDSSFVKDVVPEIEKSSLEDLLTTISASMLVIAVFAVGSMLSAFSTASGTATPRSFQLVVADNVSQNALSVFIGSFIFSIVAEVALKNGYYGKAGIFTLFGLTIFVFALVIVTFLNWVEQIAKLGRLGHTIKKIEVATHSAISQRIKEPFLGGLAMPATLEMGVPIYGEQIGYVQHIDMERLQEIAKNSNAFIILNCLPGTFCTPDKPIAYLKLLEKSSLHSKNDLIIKAFTIEDNRSFIEDPRFGLIALSEIASRALSPGINDPGTAIAIISSHVRLFTVWVKGKTNDATEKVKYDRIQVSKISSAAMFDDAFRPLARDGASNIEVMITLQKALISIAHVGDAEIKTLALEHSKQAFERAAVTMEYKPDVDVLKKECLFAKS